MINNIILAYKKQKAMKSATPIFLHDLLDKPMIDYIIEALNDEAKKIYVNNEEITLFDKYKINCDVCGISSEEELYKDLCHLSQEEGYAIITNGNTPTISQNYIKQLVNAYKKSNTKIMALTYNLKQTGVFCIDNSLFTTDYKTLTQLLDKNNNDSHDIISEDEFFPITNRYQLSMAENDKRREIMKDHLFNGVSIKNMDSVTIGPDVVIGEETIIYPNTYITGKVKIGKFCKLGPFLRIRQAATLGDGVKIGNFVELKNAKMGNKSASAHLSYLGDTTIGEQVNIGCGVITVNYDGANKHQTIIEDDAFIGCNANLVAPVTIGKSALVAAGSTVTKDVPPQSLCFARAKQINKEGYKRKRKKQ